MLGRPFGASRGLGRGKEAVPYEPQEPPTVTPSDFTVSFSGLSGEELKRVYYDESHHGICTLFMYFNPFWGRDNDLRSDLDAETKMKVESGFLQETSLAIIRGVVNLGRYVMLTLIGVSLLMFIATGLLRQLAAGSTETIGKYGMPVFWLPVLIGALLLQIPWMMYVIHLAQKCRLVITDRTIIFIVNQLPFRDMDKIPIPADTFIQASPKRTALCWLVRSSHFLISTIEDKERLPGWLYARKREELESVFAWLSYVYQSKHTPRRYNSGMLVRARGNNPAPVDRRADTIEIPVVQP